MDDTGDFFGGLLFAALLYFLIPVQAAVHPVDWAQAEEICKLNGGIETVERPDYSVLFLGQYQVSCNNGGVFFPTSARFATGG